MSGSGRGGTRRPVLYLHIGEPKSGTTFLQEIVWNNREALREQGLRLPGSDLEDHFRASQDLRGASHDDGDPSLRGQWDALVREALRSPTGSALISQEHLCGARAEHVVRAAHTLLGAEVHVILTVRDFASLLPAEWQETVKHRNTRAWTPWLGDIRRTESRDAQSFRARWFWRAHDTEAVLRRWSVVAPPERTHVITMPRDRSRPELLWQRFAGVLDLDPAAVVTDRARSNATLGMAETELLRRLNLRLGDEIPEWFYLAEVKEHLAQGVLAQRPAGVPPRLPAQHLSWARERGERVVEHLRAGGYDVVGDLEELRCGHDTAREVRRPTEGSVLDSAVDALALLLREQYRERSRPWHVRGAAQVNALASAPRVRRAARRLTGRLR